MGNTVEACKCFAQCYLTPLVAQATTFTVALDQTVQRLAQEPKLSLSTKLRLYIVYVA